MTHFSCAKICIRSNAVCTPLSIKALKFFNYKLMGMILRFPFTRDNGLRLGLKVIRLSLCWARVPSSFSVCVFFAVLFLHRFNIESVNSGDMLADPKPLTWLYNFPVAHLGISSHVLKIQLQLVDVNPPPDVLISGRNHIVRPTVWHNFQCNYKFCDMKITVDGVKRRCKYFDLARFLMVIYIIHAGFLFWLTKTML